MLKLRYDVFGAEVLGNARFDGKYEFPTTPGIRLDEAPPKVVPFDRMGTLTEGDWLHFYVHDKRFLNLLAKRRHYHDLLMRAGGFIGIDNSIYRDLPFAEQIHSCYLNRATDWYLHTLGKPVVPNVSWGDWRSREFFCDGIAPESTITVSTYGCCRSAADKAHFEEGFVFAIEHLRPYSVVLHGAVWPRLDELISYHHVKLLKLATQRESKQGRSAHHG